MGLLLKSEDMASFGGCCMPWVWAPAPTSNCVKPSEGTDCLKSHHRRVSRFVRLRRSAFQHSKSQESLSRLQFQCMIYADLFQYFVDTETVEIGSRRKVAVRQTSQLADILFCSIFLPEILAGRQFHLWLVFISHIGFSLPI